MAEASAYLRRAYGLISEVENQLEEFRQHAITQNQGVEEMQGFGGFIEALQGGRRLAQQKAKLLSDLTLAWSELERAGAADSDVVVAHPDGDLTLSGLRACALLCQGQLEMISGTPTEAERLFAGSLQHVETPTGHYYAGLACEYAYRQAEALQHFERCLELEPDGEYAVAALREANDMRNYKKRFRGSWGTLGLFALFCFPAAPVYFALKYR